MLALPSGSWLTGFLPAVSVIAAGTGISWAIAGADYSRYQSPSSSSKSIFAAVMGGACLPLMLLMLAGILLSVQLPDLASAANPIALIGSVLPARMAIPYLLAATAGIVTIAVLSLYSASLNLLTIGVQVKQWLAVSIDAVVVLGIALYVLFISGDFMGPFISFWCSAAYSAAREAIFLLDYLCLRRRHGMMATLCTACMARTAACAKPRCSAGSSAPCAACWSPKPVLSTARWPKACSPIPALGCLYRSR